MSLAKHEIWVANDEPFNERFQRISPPMVEDMRAQVKEMLEVGTICPSQSPWCNTGVLVRKKDGVLLHRLLQVECEDQERFLSIIPHTGGPGESCRGWVFLLPGPKSRFLADHHG